MKPEPKGRTFGYAVMDLRNRGKVRRLQWEFGTYLVLLNAMPLQFTVPENLGPTTATFDRLNLTSTVRRMEEGPCIVRINERRAPTVWQPTQEDILAEDWVVLDN